MTRQYFRVTNGTLGGTFHSSGSMGQPSAPGVPTRMIPDSANSHTPWPGTESHPYEPLRRSHALSFVPGRNYRIASDATQQVQRAAKAAPDENDSRRRKDSTPLIYCPPHRASAVAAAFTRAVRSNPTIDARRTQGGSHPVGNAPSRKAASLQICLRASQSGGKIALPTPLAAAE